MKDQQVTEGCRSVLFYFKTNSRFIFPSWIRLSNNLHCRREIQKPLFTNRQTHNGIISKAAYFLLNSTSSSELAKCTHAFPSFTKGMEAKQGSDRQQAHKGYAIPLGRVQGWHCSLIIVPIEQWTQNLKQSASNSPYQSVGDDKVGDLFTITGESWRPISWMSEK